MVRRTVLTSGLRVLTEAVSGVRSAAFGIWIDVGSRDEVPSLAGASHYLEHLLFKGTRRRSAHDIAAAMDGVGGEANAFTAKEQTCFYARVLDTDLPLAIDVTCDMVASSLVRAADVEAERSVVLEEIAMHDDDPSDVAHDAFAEQVFGVGSPLGRPILGTVESIEGMSRAAVAGYYRRRYRLPSMVVSAAGAVDHATVVRQVERAFAAAGVGEEPAEPAPRRAEELAARAPRALRAGSAPAPAVQVIEQDTEQVHVVLGGRGLARTDPRRFAWQVLSTALGGGASSRLFQSVREQRGLAYSVYTFSSGHADAGLWGVSFGCSPDRLGEALAVTRAELHTVAEGGLSQEELRRAQGQLRGSLVLGLEDTGDRMTRLGKGELAYGEVLAAEELLRRTSAVTLDDVRAVAADLLTAPLAVTALGDVSDGVVERAVA